MPYIKEERRRMLNDTVDKLVEDINANSRAGELNYIITNLLVLSLWGEESYKLHNENIGVLESVKLEYYRRLVAPYEDEKIEENGDIDVYDK